MRLFVLRCCTLCRTGQLKTECGGAEFYGIRLPCYRTRQHQPDDTAMTPTTPDQDSLGFRSYGGEAKLHCHDFHQIVLPRHGALELEIGGRGGRVEGRQAAFIAAGTRHAFRAEGGNRFVVLDTGDPAFGEAALDRLARAAFFPIGQPVLSLIDFLGSMTADAVAGPLRAHWCGLFHAALTGGPAGNESGALDRALAFMRARLDQPITIRDIAREAGLSETRLHTLFRAEHGMAPHAALIEIRLDRALELLATTRLPVAEIALLTGHGDQSGLTRRLRQSRGLTPAAFRRVQSAGSA